MTWELSRAFALYGVAGWLYFAVVGAAAAPWLLPRAWRPFWPAAVPFVGWALVVAAVYPLNAALPAAPVLRAVGIGALVVLVGHAVRSRRRGWPVPERTAWFPAGIGGLAYAAHASLYVRAETLSSLVADSDVEHFADVVAALLRYPIGWSLEAQMGLEATPVGLAYHYVHAALSAITLSDTFATGTASHVLMLGLAPSAIYVFARAALGLSPQAAAVASALMACSGTGLGVAAFGWGQQTAAIAAIPAGIAGVRQAVGGSSRGDVISGGLLAALAAGSLYLATAPVVVGTAALYAAMRAASRWSLRPLLRVGALATVILSAGALSHASAGGYFLLKGGLGGQDTAGRSTHVASFASIPAAVGTAPFDLFRVWGGAPGAESVVSAAGAASAALLIAVGVTRGRALTSALLIAAAGFEVYLRTLRPFPYGEFKLLTSVWFLVPCLVAAAANRGRLALIPAAVFAAAVVAAHLEVRTLLASPWGAVLAEREMSALRRTVTAIPSGAAVWVSGQIIPSGAVQWQGAPTSHRAGFVSREAGAGYLAHRWRGAATALLAFSGRPAFGLVQRHSTELRAPLEPLDADFLLLDDTEDPLVYGLVDAELVSGDGTLRLFRSPTPARDVKSAPLPIGDSLPGRRQGFTVPRATDTLPRALAAGPGHVATGLFATREIEVEVRWTAGARLVALFPGLTWYVAPAGVTAVTVDRAGGDGVSVVASHRLQPERWLTGEAVVRSSLGVRAPAVWLAPSQNAVDAYFANLTADQVSVAARVKTADVLWLHGQPASDSVSLDPGATRSNVRLTREARAAVWLEVGADTVSVLHAPPVGTAPGAYSLPLLGRPAAPPRVEDGTLVKGTSARLFAVETGRLRWVPTLEALQRRGPAPRIVTLGDADLWRLPLGLPLD